MPAVAATAMAFDPKPPAVLHVDLDGFADICRVHGWTVDGPHDPLFDTGMRRALEFFAEHGIRATFFTIAQDVHDHAKLGWLREAVRQGHEIGSHSVTHRCLSGLSTAEKRSETRDSRLLLEQALGVAVDGFRAPGFRTDAEVLRLVGEAGYAYDSSLFPPARGIRSKGPRAQSAAPHLLGDAGSLLELPMPAHSPLPLPFHPSYSLVLGSWYFARGLARARRTRAPLVLLFHLTDFADPVDGAMLPGWKARVFTLSFLSAATKRRRCARMLQEVAQHYRLMATTTLVTAARDALAREGRA
jgi:peptidoglycan/xylan/chitin deacetylase (PgdA/CDA1 family)